MKSELLARLVLFTLLAAALAAGAFAFGPLLGLGFSSSRAAVELHAAMPENGGWSLGTIQAAVGQPIHLRLTSDDVLHSFAVGQSAAAPIDILPGKWVETTLAFDRPGRYTYYCTRWCGRNHWRMRGTILVEDAQDPAGAVQPQAETAPTDAPLPLYLQLGLDVDAPHDAGVVPQSAMSAERGKALEPRLPAYALERDTYLKYSPAAVWKRLRAEPSLGDLDDTALWDAVAWIWQRQTTPAALAAAAERYSTNCAACHGETGRGDGVMVAGLPRFDPAHAHQAALAAPEEQTGGGLAGGEMGLSAPGDFTDPRLLLGASPALLEGKLLRGGMGTGMPYWGPIFTQEELEALVAYLYTFAMER